MCFFRKVRMAAVAIATALLALPTAGYAGQCIERDQAHALIERFNATLSLMKAASPGCSDAQAARFDELYRLSREIGSIHARAEQNPACERIRLSCALHPHADSCWRKHGLCSARHPSPHRLTSRPIEVLRICMPKRNSPSRVMWAFFFQPTQLVDQRNEEGNQMEFAFERLLPRKTDRLQCAPETDALRKKCRSRPQIAQSGAV